MTLAEELKTKQYWKERWLIMRLNKYIETYMLALVAFAFTGWIFLLIFAAILLGFSLYEGEYLLNPDNDDYILYINEDELNENDKKTLLESMRRLSTDNIGNN